MLCCVGLVVASCNAEAAPALPTPEVLDLPEDQYVGVAWLGDSTMVATATRQTSRGSSDELLVIEGDEVEPIALEPVDPCRRESIRTLSTLPDGRLGFAVDCDAVAGEFTPSSVRVLDLATGASEEVARLPSGGFGGYTFSPGFDRGLMADSSRICSTIAEIANGEVISTEIVVNDGDRSFGISDQFRDRPDSCTEYGNADLPAWSPDGTQIAFFASSAAIGSSGPERLAAPWNLYLMEPDDKVAEPVLTGITSPYKLTWSRDSRHLAFSADEFDGRVGVWVFTPESGEVRQVADELVFQLSWSPEGDRLAGLGMVSDLDGPSQIVIVRTGLEE